MRWMLPMVLVASLAGRRHAEALLPVPDGLEIRWNEITP